MVFLAFYHLIIEKNQMVSDRDKLIERVRNSADHINVQSGGGRWGADNRQKATQAAIGLYQDAFQDSNETDPAKVLWITQLQNLLSQSYTEQNSYDFKQGFFALSDSPVFDDNSLNKIFETLSAMANNGPGKVGYVVVGVSETEQTTQRINKIFGVEARPYETFWVTGVDHEADALGKSADQLFQLIVDRVKQSDISEPLKGYVASNIKAVRYYDKTVYVFETRGMTEPSLYNGEYYVRVGSQVEKLEASQLASLFKRYA